MRSTTYLVVGAGMSGDMACRGIREHDAHGTIALVGDEPVGPYKRPPLTKGLWSGDDESKIWRDTSQHGADVVTGRRIVSLDLDGHTARDSTGEEYRYERLVLATGGTPRSLSGRDADVVYFRTLADYHRVRGLSDGGRRFLVVGGGFIGSEIAAALRTNGSEVTMVFPEAGIGARMFPEALCASVTDAYRERGVEVIDGALVANVDGSRLTLEDGSVHEADCIVAGLGIVPQVDLAEQAGLVVEDGIVVDEFARVQGRDHVFAAGDVARFPAAALGTMRRVEHEDHANTHGRLAGANAAGAGKPYDHLPYFYSDLFDLGYEAVGEVDSRRPTVELWLEPFRKGVVAYTDDDGRARGFLLWNVWSKVDAARELIRAGATVDDDALRTLAG